MLHGLCGGCSTICAMPLVHALRIYSLATLDTSKDSPILLVSSAFVFTILLVLYFVSQRLSHWVNDEPATVRDVNTGLYKPSGNFSLFDPIANWVIITPGIIFTFLNFIPHPTVFNIFQAYLWVLLYTSPITLLFITLYSRRNPAWPYPSERFRQSKGIIGENRTVLRVVIVLLVAHLVAIASLSTNIVFDRSLGSTKTFVVQQRTKAECLRWSLHDYFWPCIADYAAIINFPEVSKYNFLPWYLRSQDIDEISISEVDYNKIVDHTTSITIETHMGFWGMPWHSSGYSLK